MGSVGGWFGNIAHTSCRGPFDARARLPEPRTSNGRIILYPVLPRPAIPRSWFAQSSHQQSAQRRQRHAQRHLCAAGPRNHDQIAPFACWARERVRGEDKRLRRSGERCWPVAFEDTSDARPRITSRITSHRQANSPADEQSFRLRSQPSCREQGHQSSERIQFSVGLALGRLDEPSAYLSDLGDEAGGLIEQARRLFLRDGDHRRIVAPRPQIESPT